MSRPLRHPDDGAADRQLVARVAAGDRTAVDDLYERFRRPAFALARRVVADDVLAEDVLQEVFLAVWRDPGTFDASRGTVASWLLSAVHHKAVDAVRREESHRRRQARAVDELALAAPAAVPDEAADRVAAATVRTALQALPESQREVLALVYYGGYTQREVAALTGAPLGTVKTRLLAGVRRLTDALGAGVPGATPADGTAR
ncbi:sigma-70 family RNA polymerase sigma factor [Modestobacter sp. SYSU DS0875]